MDNNTKPEVKEPVKNEPVKKPAVAKKTNAAPKQPLDKQDALCYAGAVFFLIMAFLPTILRSLDPTYEEGGRVEETPIKIKKVNKLLSCNAHFKETGFIYTVEVTSKYTDSQVQHTQLKYVIQLDTASGLTFEDVVIPEYDNISSIKSNGIKAHKDIDQFVVEIDYRLDEKLRDNEFLEKHSKMITIQRQNYQDESFQCVITEGSNENN